jgi:TIGR03009 family protein
MMSAFNHQAAFPADPWTRFRQRAGRATRGPVGATLLLILWALQPAVAQQRQDPQPQFSNGQFSNGQYTNGQYTNGPNGNPQNAQGGPRPGVSSRVPAPQRAAAGPIPPGAEGNTFPRSPLQPAWVPLPLKHQQYVDQILGYWEHKSGQIERFRCTFKRWEYDPVFGPKETFYRYGEGQIKFANPDKGLYKVDKVLTYQAPKTQEEKPRYVELPNVFGEHWVCNGLSVFELDHQRKRLIQTELPPEMRGEAIRSGPLPFLFGAKKEEIQQRYWVRVITPTDVKGEYWLEAYPKTREDGANFKMVHIILDEKDYLPKGLVLFDRSFVAGRHPARTTFSFENRETNWNVLVQQLNLLHKEFYEPSVPRDWEKVVNKHQPGNTAQAPTEERRQQR